MVYVISWRRSSRVHSLAQEYLHSLVSCVEFVTLEAAAKRLGQGVSKGGLSR
jgi:hypothetical protein